MADTWIDGAELWFPAEVQLVEIIRFVDRRYLGAITTRGSPLFYASLMRKPCRTKKTRMLVHHGGRTRFLKP